LVLIGFSSWSLLGSTAFAFLQLTNPIKTNSKQNKSGFFIKINIIVNE